jgi:hypothetical protein
MEPLPEAVMLATEQSDYGLVPSVHAEDIAHMIANQDKCTVYLRHPISDAILRRISPKKGIPNG